MERATQAGTPDEFVASVRLLAFHLRKLSECDASAARIYQRYAWLYEAVADRVSERTGKPH